ncbi:hypothetical protein GCM10018954_024500 [Kutzneria kofuensis]
MQFPQLRPGIGAEILGQPRPYGLVPAQRLGLPAGPVQGQHQLPGGAFVERVLGGPGQQLRHERGVLAEAQPQVGVVQLGGEPLAGQPAPLLDGPVGVQPGQRLAPPQREGPLEHRGIVGAPGLGDQASEQVHVDGQRILDEQRVAARPPHDRHAVDAAQPGQVAVQGAGGALRRVLAPHPVHQLVDRHDGVDVDEQGGQHALLPRVADVGGPSVDRRRDCAQQCKPCSHEPCIVPVACGFKRNARKGAPTWGTMAHDHAASRAPGGNRGRGVVA